MIVSTEEELRVACAEAQEIIRSYFPEILRVRGPVICMGSKIQEGYFEGQFGAYTWFRFSPSFEEDGEVFYEKEFQTLPLFELGKETHDSIVTKIVGSFLLEYYRWQHGPNRVDFPETPVSYDTPQGEK